LDTLLDAWSNIGDTLPLKILGDGPLAARMEDCCQKNPHIAWLGRRSGPEVLRYLSDATCLVMPSQWYECCPKTLIETLAVGTPAIVANLGAMAEMIEHERTGLHFSTGNASDLAAQVRRLANDTVLQRNMRSAARQEYEDKYTAVANYEQLIDIYRGVVTRPETSLAATTEEATEREFTASLI
jgi:glycosyltransferase involved in cell wall biosynthesis